MFAVIFEVQPKAEEWTTYLDLAKMLKPELEQIEGFIDNERFMSQRTEWRVLSLSTWRDEKAVIRWRTLGVHHGVQERGRAEVFAGYHLRVGEVTADSQVPEGQSLRQERFDTTAVGKAQVVTITEASLGVVAPSPTAYDRADGLVDWERYEGITIPGKALWLASWQDEAALAGWRASRAQGSGEPEHGTVRYRAVRVIRDYGMHDRREAPQYYPPVEPTIPATHAEAQERNAR